MDISKAKNLITQTFEHKFDKTQFRNFIVDFLDGINERKAFNVGNAQVKVAFQKNILSYSRVGQYTDKSGEIIDVLTVHVNAKCSLDRSRTMLRNFVADYMHTRQKENALVAFYSDSTSDWRFSFVKLEMSLQQDDKGNIKIVNEFTPAKRFSYLVGELEPNHTAQSRLINILLKEYPTLEDIEEAFNVEKVSKEFFANYKELFLKLVDNLKNIRSKDDRINFEFTTRSITEANFCKKLMGQLVFLYFIQKKGWLGVKRSSKWGEGDKKFLRHTFDRAVREGKNFFNDYLEPLFYNALANGERDEQLFELLDCKIPFLNGGLFDPVNGYDWVNTDIVFDNELFSNNNKTTFGDTGDGILDVFDRYNFTVKEDEPLEKEVAVDPEMLGKVFEELLEVQDRKSKGAFYTPREIVHYMCQESLINYLCTELSATENEENSQSLSKQDIANFIHHSDKFSERENIATQRENKNSVYVHILSDNIRQNAEAIDKALEKIKICDPAIGSGAFPVGMLNEIVRARMALVESNFLKETRKRSIYEYKRQAIQNSIYGVDIEDGAVEIAKLRLWLSLVVDEENIENIKTLPNLDYKIVRGNSLLGVERNLFNDSLFRQLEELKPQFFEESKKAEKRRLKKQIDAIIKELTKDGTFDFEIFFSEVFHEKGGFDVVIANPPYISALECKKIIPSHIRDQYKKSYISAQGAYDLYIIFFELGIKINKKGGTLTYITPSKYLSAEYATALRKYFLNNISIDRISDFSTVKVFESAGVSTIITQVSKTSQKDFLECRIYQNTTDIRFKQKYSKDILFMCPNNIWSCLINQNVKLFRKLVEKSEILADWADVNACSTAAEAEIYENSLVQNKDQFCFKYINNGTIIKYWNVWKTKPIRKGNLLRPYLPEGVITERRKKMFSLPKLIFSKLSKTSKVCIDLQGMYASANTNMVYNIKSYNMKFLLGYLNSKTYNFSYRMMFGGLSMLGTLQFQAPQIKKSLIPSLKNNHFNLISKSIEKSVDKILSITQTDDYLQNQEKQEAVKEYEKQIDIMVYKLYDLTYEEVKFIDKDFSLSEEEYMIADIKTGEYESMRMW